jgi:hypothetical protein
MEATMANLLNIVSVQPAAITAGMQLIEQTWKTTEKQIIPAANKYRAVELPADLWTTDDTISSARDSLKLFMLDAIYDLAKAYLKHIVEDSNWQRSQVDVDSFKLDALLAWNAERAALAGRLNAEAITAWLAESVTVKAFTAKKGADVGKALGAQLVKLAGPNHGLTAERATQLLTNIWQAEDVGTMMGLRIYNRIQAIANKKPDADVMAAIWE